MAEVALQLASLLETAEPPELGPGPRKGVRPIAELRREVGGVFTVVDGANLDLVLGTVLLWHDHLEEAHEIAQGIETQDGSYLHAIMHRREPDYSNAKYWFRRVGRHACYGDVARYVTEKVSSRQPELARKLAPGGEWDAFAFVDACEAASGRSSANAGNLLREIQAAEFTTFLNHLIPTGGTPGE